MRTLEAWKPMMPVRAIACLTAAFSLIAAGPSAPIRRICSGGTGMHDGFFYTFWKDGGDACMTLANKGRYIVDYRLGTRQNLVVGKGWRVGSADRTIGYRAARFAAGTNSYLALYGWSTDPLVEYYVVDGWGRAFTPPGNGAAAVGTVESDGGTYRIYRTQRVQKPSIRGTQTFHQFWSVRIEQRPLGGTSKITFANHVAAWRKHGLALGRMDYQVLATEGFGSHGGSDVTVWAD